MPSNTRNRFAGRVAIVTGAGSGIGQGVARQIALEGGHVFCADIHEANAQATAVAAGPLATAHRLDVTEETSWSALFDRVKVDFGRLDILVNSAGVSAGAPIDEMSLADWRRVMSINLDGAFLGTKLAIQKMKSSGGNIVHVSSASGIKAAGGAAAYSASKAGLCMLTRVAAKECRDQNWAIRVNAVCPAGVKTPMWTSMPFFKDMVQQTGSVEAAYSKLAAGMGGKFAEVADVVAAILFLCSDESRFITGTDLLVDGGYVL